MTCEKSTINIPASFSVKSFVWMVRLWFQLLPCILEGWSGISPLLIFFFRGDIEGLALVGQNGLVLWFGFWNEVSQKELVTSFFTHVGKDLMWSALCSLKDIT